METNNKTLTFIAWCLGFISTAILIIALMELKSILIPISISILMTYLFHPIVNFCVKKKIPKAVSIILVIILVFASIYLGIILLIASLGDFNSKFLIYEQKFQVFLSDILAPFQLTLEELLKIFSLSGGMKENSSFFSGLFNSGIIELIISSLTGMLGNIFLIIIFSLFMISGKDLFDSKVKFAFSSEKKNLLSTFTNIDNQIQSYLAIKAWISLLTGVITTIILLIFNVDFAFFWGFLTFILNFIPNIGSMIATIFPIAISLLQFGFGFNTIFVSILLIVNQVIIGNIVEPYYLGKKLNLSPMYVLLSLIFWGWVWGVIGMFLAVPIAVIVKIIAENINPLKPFSILMGGKLQESGNGK